MSKHLPRHIEQRARALQSRDKAESGETASHFDFYLGWAVREQLERVGIPVRRIDQIATTLWKFESPAFVEGFE